MSSPPQAANRSSVLEAKGPVLEAKGIVKTFPGVRALDGAGIRLRAGRLNALMGENGAGKSTLMNILAGVFLPDEGDLLLDGQRVEFGSPAASQNAGIAIIHQEFNLAENLTVAENLMLGREPTGRLGLVDYGAMRAEAARQLERIGARLRPDQRVGRLTAAEKQTVEIAKALSLNARVLILDEPTSAISVRETENLFRLIDQLKKEGVALAYITHRFEELEAIADDVTVFRDGRLVDECDYVGLSRDELVRMMIGRDTPADPAHNRGERLDPILTVRNLALTSTGTDRPIVDRVSLDVGGGEIVGLYGLMGAGRTELLETLFGVHPGRTTGEITIDGETVRHRSPRDAYRAGLSLVPEDRKEAGLVLGMDLVDNTTMASLQKHLRFGLLSKASMRRDTQQYADRLGTRHGSLNQPVGKLSGGNQQKVVIAKQLATVPRVLLLDEPTRGIDVGAKQEVYALIRQLAAEGCGVLVASSEAPEVLRLSDRVLVMREGRLAGEFARDEANEERLLAAALPLAASGRVA